MEDLVELLARWKLHPDVLVTHRYKLKDAATAYGLFDAGKTGKVAFVWDDLYDDCCIAKQLYDLVINRYIDVWYLRARKCIITGTIHRTYV